MLKLDKPIPNRLLLGLVHSTITGIEKKDCFYDQLHYVNRKFIESNSDEFLDIVIDGLKDLHPGLSRSDIAYVNDFVAPVNLENSAVRPVSELNKENKYQWHIDSIDQWMGPCYNLWIPLYRQKALGKLDEKPLFEVMTAEDVPSLYDEDSFPKSNFLIDGETQSPDYLSVAQEFTSLDMRTLKESFLYYDAKGKISTLSKSDMKTSCVVKPSLGDAYIFRANQFHSSGPSQFERIGIAVKVIITNPKFGFKEHDKFRYPPPFAGWEGLFAGCYAQYKDFTSFKKYLDFSIVGEQVELRKNQEKLDNINIVLSEIAQEMQHFADTGAYAPESDNAQQEEMEMGFL
ncbi:hypothetical protein BGP78_18595 [Pseudoalteromonas sp. MSK9-3]|uniref:hypothetical protein n=1 Tax=Pseudoalteromonas sp. MSK9-3 TaxID=1897633 RepID=UPI000E6D4F0D|nr:hypothetical protein [Pseudoalteromonas sp. MSK9-3]RJE73426.1 hypothetical protein BGP78_18595 [Pseudoalteromonas sp. MSK9-3]